MNNTNNEDSYGSSKGALDFNVPFFDDFWAGSRIRKCLFEEVLGEYKKIAVYKTKVLLNDARHQNAGMIFLTSGLVLYAQHFLLAEASSERVAVSVMDVVGDKARMQRLNKQCATEVEWALRELYETAPANGTDYGSVMFNAKGHIDNLNSFLRTYVKDRMSELSTNGVVIGDMVKHDAGWWGVSKEKHEISGVLKDSKPEKRLAPSV